MLQVIISNITVHSSHCSLHMANQNMSRVVCTLKNTTQPAKMSPIVKGESKKPYALFVLWISRILRGLNIPSLICFNSPLKILPAQAPTKLG